jgi:D-aspartate ligase
VTIRMANSSETPSASAKPMKESVGAVVVGGDYQGLGIARSLGRRKIPVCVIDDERSIARFSKYTTHAVGVDSLRDEERTVDHILRIGRRLNLRGWVLYPTRDETVAAFSRHRSSLTEFFRVPTPAWDTTQWVWDKRNTYRRAQELGMPTPSTWYLKDVTELDKIDGEPPFVIKPAIKEHFIYSTKAKAWRANNRTELREMFQRAAALVGPGEVMIQGMIPGDGRQQFAYCAFYKEGKALGSMVVRRTRQHPPEFGRSSTYVETIDLPEIEALSERFLRAVNYYGLVELEYKFDSRDQQYKLLDVNGRTWGYHTLGTGAGVDFPYMLFADQMGEVVELIRGRAGVKWIRLVTDLPTGVIEILGGRQNLWAYLRTLTGFHVESVFSREDPLPGLAELVLIPYLAVRRGF